ncbi:MAG TPA: hypothetical protein VNL14_16430 [Candidatus Acidoferrales bacterium]|nr:hypothetical protein [Candidatus Acidoferrales bacterium]
MESNQNQNPFAASGLFVNTADVWTPFKMSFEGFAGAGKSLTMYLMALGIWEEEGKTKTVLLQDTEQSAKFVVPFYREHGLIEGQNLFITASRSLVDFGKILDLAEKHRAILMIDTVTHLYEEMLRQFSIKENRPIKYPGDAMILKPLWKEKFSTPFVNARNCHILFTGRAAWEYTMEVNEQGKKEFNPTGVKMRGDNETAFEPDLLVLMEREQEVKRDGVNVFRMATVMKDRSRVLDGKQFRFDPMDTWEAGENRVWDTFKPVYKFLASGSQDQKRPTDTPMGPLFQTGNAEAYWARRRQVEILIEEIDGIYNQWMPGSGGLEKQLRSIIFNAQFNTRSKSALAELHPDDLRDGKDVVEHLAKYVAKNFDLLEKMHKDGQYEQINAFVLEEKQRVDQAAMEKAREIEDDDIPKDWMPADQDKPEQVKSEQTMLKLIEEDVTKAQTIDELHAVRSTLGDLLKTMKPQHRKRIEDAFEKRSSELVEKQPEPAKGKGKNGKGKAAQLSL